MEADAQFRPHPCCGGWPHHGFGCPGERPLPEAPQQVPDVFPEAPDKLPVSSPEVPDHTPPQLPITEVFSCTSDTQANNRLRIGWELLTILPSGSRSEAVYVLGYRGVREKKEEDSTSRRLQQIINSNELPY